MTNCKLQLRSIYVNVYKNMTVGQFCSLKLLTVGQFCDIMGIVKNDRWSYFKVYMDGHLKGVMSECTNLARRWSSADLLLFP